MALRAAGCAALVALMLRGIAEHYSFLPRLQTATIYLCALCLVGAALERAGSGLEASRAAQEGDVG